MKKTKKTKMTHVMSPEDIIKNLLLIAKKIKLSEDSTQSQGNEITKQDFLKAMRTVELDSTLTQVIPQILEIDNMPEKYGQFKLLQYMTKVPVSKKLSISDDVKSIIKRMYKHIDAEYMQIPIYNEMSYSDGVQTLYKQFNGDLKQQVDKNLSHKIAKLLSLQLMSNSNASSCVFLHGPIHANLNQIADKVASTFVKYDFEILTIDCSRYDGQTEKFVWCGSPSVWSGSRAGELTKHVYQHPKSVIVLQNIEKANPAVTECLISALNKGIMVDECGLDKDKESSSQSQYKSEPTRVDFSEVVFIITSNEANDFYEQKRFLTAIEEDPEHAYAILADKLKQSTRYIRSKEVKVINESLLPKLIDNMLIYCPSGWEIAVKIGSKALKLELEKLASQWDIGDITINKKTIRLFAKLFLLNSKTMNLSANDWALTLLDTHIDTAIQGQKSNSAIITITATQNAIKTLTDFEINLGMLPQATMLKKGIELIPVFSKSDNGISLTDIKVKPIVNTSDLAQDKIHLKPDYPNLSLDDVIGHQPVKDYLKDMSIYLRNPQALIELNVPIPKGVMLYGKPGTGKTHLARCFAGEAQLPLIVISASELLHPERMTQFIDLKKRYSPCVIFIDEADALKSREVSINHSIAINTLLAEIQGFEQDADLISFYILATNFPNEIDPALLRSGRIDKAYHISSLDDEGRSQFLPQLKNYLHQECIDNGVLITWTHGFTGAQMQQLIQECALAFIKSQNTRLKLAKLQSIIHQVRMGKEVDASLKFDEDYKKTIAVHEVGHALVRNYLNPENGIQLLALQLSDSAIGGYVKVAENSVAMNKQQIIKEIAVLMGGRVAEQICFGKEYVSMGCSSDLDKASKLVWHALTKCGMDEKIGLFHWQDSLLNSDHILNKNLMNTCEQWLREGEQMANEILTKQKDLILHTASKLMSEQLMDGNRFNTVLSEYRGVGRYV